MRYQVYDFTNKKYLCRRGDSIYWSWFKTDGFHHRTREEAGAWIEDARPFSTNDYRILEVKNRTGDVDLPSPPQSGKLLSYPEGL